MRTIHGIKLTLTGMLISNFKLKGCEDNQMAVDTAQEIIDFLLEEENLIVPPLEKE